MPCFSWRRLWDWTWRQTVDQQKLWLLLWLLQGTIVHSMVTIPTNLLHHHLWTIVWSVHYLLYCTQHCLYVSRTPQPTRGSLKITWYLKLCKYPIHGSVQGVVNNTALFYLHLLKDFKIKQQVISLHNHWCIVSTLFGV